MRSKLQPTRSTGSKRAIFVELKRDEDMRRLTVITRTERGVC
ncbi:hypothetical protein [Bradyrhizobium sp. CB3481]|nr:hypothetical protein [Bradyrhizobium sp. CB3481]WFU19445.1 hypothetical protein QA643_14495 [Bradyrhizobium sp. CB3481]